jgi:hypothetical protein
MIVFKDIIKLRVFRQQEVKQKVCKDQSGSFFFYSRTVTEILNALVSLLYT